MIARAVVGVEALDHVAPGRDHHHLDGRVRLGEGAVDRLRDEPTWSWLVITMLAAVTATALSPAQLVGLEVAPRGCQDGRGDSAPGGALDQIPIVCSPSVGRPSSMSTSIEGPYFDSRCA